MRKLVCFFFFLFSFSGYAVELKTKAHITVPKIVIDNKEYKILCDAYANKKKEGVKFTFSYGKDQMFSLFCNSSEVGADWSLIVTSKGKEVFKIDHAVFHNIDAEDTWRAEAWLVDLNRDGQLDFIKLYKKFETDLISGKSKEMTSEYTVYFGGKTDAGFVKKRIKKKLARRLKRDFKF